MLKSGGPKMTVSNVIGDTVQCLWIGEEGESAWHFIPASALMDAMASHYEEQEEDEPDYEDNGEALDAEEGGEIEPILARVLIGRSGNIG
jgi:uncharacterized protein YodC (DUF2158 family)